MFDESTLAKRRQCITGTDIAGLCGLSKWSSPLSIYCDKKGLTEPIEENKYMEWGKRLESVIAEKFMESKKITMTPGTFICDGIYGGTPDYLCDNLLLEIKTTSAHAAAQWGETGTDEIPDYYMTQIQWYLGLTGLPEAACCVLIGGNDYREYYINRNDTLIDILRKKADEFWTNHIEKNDAPIASLSVDNSVVASLYRSHSDQILDRPSFDDTAQQLAKLKDDNKKLADEIDHLEAVLKQQIGDNSGIRSACWTATWKKISDSYKTDWFSVAKELGINEEIVKKHTKNVTGYRRFVFKSNF